MRHRRTMVAVIPFLMGTAAAAQPGDLQAVARNLVQAGMNTRAAVAPLRSRAGLPSLAEISCRGSVQAAPLSV
jgi:hypothetical protein